MASLASSSSVAFFEALKNLWVVWPSSVLAVKIRAVSGSCRASYSCAIDLAELRYAGCVVTSSTLSPFKNTVRPSRKLSKYSLPFIIGTSPIHNLSIEFLALY
ncbi:Uncharacterised protein [Chlamydia trachomatis]|nr:Uncharacterised protein [Chlamydia trachomatis]